MTRQLDLDHRPALPAHAASIHATQRLFSPDPGFTAMNVSVYRCRATYLLVPPCFLPSMEAVATHGPARFRGTILVEGPAADALMRAMEDKAYVALALDHPLTNSRTFPRALAMVGIGRDGLERRQAVLQPAAGSQGVLPLAIRRAERLIRDADESQPYAVNAHGGGVQLARSLYQTH